MKWEAARVLTALGAGRILRPAARNASFSTTSVVSALSQRAKSFAKAVQCDAMNSTAHGSTKSLSRARRSSG